MATVKIHKTTMVLPVLTLQQTYIKTETDKSIAIREILQICLKNVELYNKSSFVSK